MTAVPVIPTFQSGYREHSGEGLNQLGAPLASIMGQGGSIPPNFPLIQWAQDNIAANAAGGQANATPMAAMMNRIAAAAAPAASVALPKSVPGLEITVTNSGANAVQVFGLGSDTVNGAAPATGVAQPAGKTATYSCFTAGAWYQQLSA